MEIKEILNLAIEKNASDLHLCTGMPPMCRIHGDLQILIEAAPILEHQEVLQILHAMTQKQFSEYVDLDFAFEIPGLARFRVNAYSQSQGAALALRIIPNQIKTMQDLKLAPIFYEIADFTSGLVLITGATGSGKSTTLAAMIDHINQHRHGHILSIEDPIEFVHKSKKSLINQRELHRDTLSFEKALRSALREDPDVILIGELRDLESIRLAITLAETGHLVLATLHSSSASQAVHRLIDVFPGEEKTFIRSILAESLQAVVAQKLIKRKEGGRVAVFEVMLGTPAIKNLIREDKIAQMISVIQTSQAKGMQTSEQHVRQLVMEGVV